MLSLILISWLVLNHGRRFNCIWIPFSLMVLLMWPLNPVIEILKPKNLLAFVVSIFVKLSINFFDLYCAVGTLMNFSSCFYFPLSFKFSNWWRYNLGNIVSIQNVCASIFRWERVVSEKKYKGLAIKRFPVGRHLIMIL